MTKPWHVDATALVDDPDAKWSDSLDADHIRDLLRAALVERDTLRAALEKYGRHEIRCDYRIARSHPSGTHEANCDCGLDAALKEPTDG